MATRGYMGRGKDGFTSLLVKSEGGEAEEIVSEENGILISMILRQYFMSLKVLGRWRRWEPSMGRHWGGVQAKLHKQPGMDVVEPNEKATTHKHTLSGNVKDQDGHTCGEEDSDDGDDDATDIENGTSDPAALEAAEKEERATHLARSVVRHWMRVAKIQSAGLVEDEATNGEMPDWTRGIAPKLEGRIVIECGGGGEGGEGM
ncbi:MAG: hypothetical protein L6R42_007488 [Xanthoria sp. 1 TBL-2021]|nr:MAG: hypothetical protein L6R42_007488 [Xanthoria sp. 1 TBL-2021]